MPAEQRQAKGEKKRNNFRRVTAELVKNTDFWKKRRRKTRCRLVVCP